MGFTETIMTLVNSVGDKERFMIMGGVWLFIVVGLLYLAWNDPTLWPAKKENDAPKAKHAEPKARPSKPVRRIPLMELWKLGVYEYVIMFFSFMVFGLASVQVNAALGREYATDDVHYRQHIRAWAESPDTMSKIGKPGAFTWDMAASIAVFAIGVGIFMLGFLPLYRSYRTLVYGKKVEGKSKGTVPDWTRSMIVIPAFAITFSWRPEGSEVDEQTTWKGLPGERWYEKEYPKDKAITVIYDEAEPARAVAPDLLHNITLIELEGEAEKKEN